MKNYITEGELQKNEAINKFSKYYSKIFFGVSVLFLLNSCQFTAIQPHDVREWVGHNSDELVSSWGVPNSTYKLQNGDTMLQYSKISTETSGGEVYPEDVCTDFSIKKFKCRRNEKRLVTSPITTTQSQCNTIVTVGANYIINDIRFQGDGCPLFYANISSNMPPPISNVPYSQSQQFGQNGGADKYCRESNSEIQIGGVNQHSYSKKCLQPDGAWKFVP